MILTTTNSVEGFKVTAYKGIVSGISYGTSYSYKGAKLAFQDIFKQKKHYEVYEEALSKIKEEAFQKLKNNAENLNADAVIGINLDIEPLANSTTLIVSVTGTAVTITANN